MYYIQPAIRNLSHHIFCHALISVSISLPQSLRCCSLVSYLCHNISIRHVEMVNVKFAVMRQHITE